MMHSRAVSCCFGTHPSSDADAMLPSGIAATAVTCHLWPCSLRIGCAVAAFHTMTDLSLEPAVLEANSSADHAAMLIANFMVDGLLQRWAASGVPVRNAPSGYAAEL